MEEDKILEEICLISNLTRIDLTMLTDNPNSIIKIEEVVTISMLPVTGHLTITMREWVIDSMKVVGAMKAEVVEVISHETKDNIFTIKIGIKIQVLALNNNIRLNPIVVVAEIFKLEISNIEEKKISRMENSQTSDRYLSLCLHLIRSKLKQKR